MSKNAPQQGKLDIEGEGAQEKGADARESFFSLSRRSWMCLVFIDVFLLLLALIFMNFWFGLIALLLAVLIEKRGSDVLLEKYNKRMEEQRARNLVLTKEQQRAVVADLYERRRAKKEARRAERAARRQRRNE